MARLCANLTLLFPELPFLDRFEAAAEAGFEGVEILFPYDDPVPEMQRALTACGLPLVLINCPPPNYTGGDRGFAAVPGAEDRFRHDFRRVLRYAEALGPEHIHVMAGAAEGGDAFRTFVDNLGWAAAEAPGQSLTIEPLNAQDNPGYFLADYDLALKVLDAVGAPNLGLQYDAYHAAKMGLDPVAVWEKTREQVRHVQIGDAPGRTAPGTGVTDFDALFARIGADGYDGWISAEYHPKGPTTAAGLGWMTGARRLLKGGGQA